jgi:parallel beta-helix repeat protein
MKLIIVTCCLLISSMLQAQHSQKQIIITGYGAVPDGISNNAVAIQKAIDDASKSGGGKVIVPRGRFVTGPIHLKPNVEFFIHEEAVLLGSINILDYKEGSRTVPLISCENGRNVSITGKGLIDGQCDYLMADIFARLRAGTIQDASWKEVGTWFKRRPGEESRPKLIEFINCDSVAVKNIRIQNGTGWIQDYRNCNVVVIDSIDVFSNTYWNNDGIDITDSKNVRITNCRVNAADDGICLKSEDRNRRCENVYIADCKIRSSANAVKLGTASHGGFRNITVKNIEVYDTYRSVIALEAVDGGVLENIDVRNMTGVNTGNAILIRLGHRNRDSVYSKARNIYIANIKVKVPKGKPDAGYTMEGPLLKYPPGFEKDPSNPYKSVSPWNHSSIDTTAVVYPHNVFPSSITGLPGHEVENVTLENIEILYEGGGSREVNYFPLDSLHAITEAETAYPEFSMFGELPAWGLYVRHVKGLTLKNVQLVLQNPDYRIGFLADDVRGLKLENVSIPDCNALPAVLLNNVKEYSSLNLKLPGNAKAALRIQ